MCTQKLSLHFLIQKNDFENQDFAIFGGSDFNFGMRDERKDKMRF